MALPMTRPRPQSATVRRPTGTAFRTEQDRSGPYSLNPHGSRGADLLETLRLDTLSGNSREIANRHPAVDARGMAVRQQTSARSKPWSETPAKFIRPKSAAARTKCRVYCHELLPQADPAFQDAGSQGPPWDATHCGDSHGPLTAAGSSGLGSLNLDPATPDSPERPNESPARSVSVAAAATRRRPASAQVVNPREMMRAKQAVETERMMRRLRQKQAEDERRQERAFSEHWARIESEEQKFVPAVTDYFELRANDQARRHKAMHLAWQTVVFDRIDAQVQRAVSVRFAGDPGARWIEAQDQYLETFTRKEGRLFRDIILADEYDPMVCATQALKYSERRVGKDPVKAEMAAAEAERAPIPVYIYICVYVCA